MSLLNREENPLAYNRIPSLLSDFLPLSSVICFCKTFTAMVTYFFMIKRYFVSVLFCIFFSVKLYIAPKNPLVVHTENVALLHYSKPLAL